MQEYMYKVKESRSHVFFLSEEFFNDMNTLSMKSSADEKQQ